MWEKFIRGVLKKIVVDELSHNKKFQQFVVDVEAKIQNTHKQLFGKAKDANNKMAGKRKKDMQKRWWVHLR